MHGRLADPRGLPRPVRRPHHRAAARRRARSSSARRTWTSSRWARRPSTPPTARRPIRGTSSACRAAAAAARRRRSPRSTRRGRHRHGHRRLDPPAGRAVRDRRDVSRRTAGSAGYGIVAFASSLDQIGPFARDARDAAALLHAVAGRDERDSTSVARCRSRRRCSTCPTSDDEAARRACAASAWACPGSTSSAGMEPGVEARDPRGRRGARGRRGDRRGGQPAAHRTTASRRTTSSRRPRRRRTSPRYDGDPVRAAAGRGRRRASRTTSRPAAAGFGAEVKRRIMLGTYALSAGYYDAYYLKAQKVRTLIKGDFDAPVGAGLRRARRADVADGRVPVRARSWPTRSSMYLSDACTLPVNMAGLPGISIPAGPVRRAAGRAPADRRAVVRGARCSGWRAASRRSPRPPTGAPRAGRPRGARATRHPTPGRARRIAPFTEPGPVRGPHDANYHRGWSDPRRVRGLRLRIAGRQEEGTMLRGCKPVSLGSPSCSWSRRARAVEAAAEVSPRRPVPARRPVPRRRPARQGPPPPTSARPPGTTARR